MTTLTLIISIEKENTHISDAFIDESRVLKLQVRT